MGLEDPAVVAAGLRRGMEALSALSTERAGTPAARALARRCMRAARKRGPSRATSPPAPWPAGIEEALKEMKAKDNILPKLMASPSSGAAGRARRAVAGAPHLSVSPVPCSPSPGT